MVATVSIDGDDAVLYRCMQPEHNRLQARGIQLILTANQEWFDKYCIAICY